MAERILFTVFTPTYNRAGTIHRVYESLLHQTFTDFEWLVVDDGSTDQTSSLIEGWRRAAPFQIRYLRQDNSGKHVAFNRGVDAARGELFLTLDSDDACVPRALERLKWHWDGIPAGELHRFSGVTCLCQDQHGKLVGDRFPRDVLDSDSLELVYRYKVRGEKWGFHRTAVLRAHPFPAHPRFVPESIVWFAIAREHRTRFANECLRVYYVHEGGESLSTLTPTVAQGRLVFHQTVLEAYWDAPAMTAAGRLRSVVNYSRYSYWCGYGGLAQLRRLRSDRARAALTVVWPLGYAWFLRDQLRRRPAAQLAVSSPPPGAPSASSQSERIRSVE